MSLAKKGALLLLIPVIIQALLLVGLILLNLETEFYPLRANQDIEIGNCWTEYVLDYFRVLQCVKRSIVHNTPLEPACNQYLEDLAKDTKNSGTYYKQFATRRHRALVFDTQPQTAREESNNLASKMLELGVMYTDRLVLTIKQAGVSKNREQSYRQTIL